MKAIKNNRYLIGTYFISFFVIYFVNRSIVTLHLVPDELGAISLISKIFNNNDYNSLWQSVGAYYGVVSGLLFAPLYIFIKDPFNLYQGMLIIEGLLVSFIGVMAFKILQTILPDNKKIIMIGSVGCVLMFGARYTNVMNEWFLNILNWAIFYCLFRLIFYKRHKNLYTFYLVLLQWIALLSHTRSIIIVLAVLITIFLVYFLEKEIIVNPWIYAIGSILGYFGAQEIIGLLHKTIYKTDSKIMINSVEMVGDKLLNNDTHINRFSLKGLRGFLDIATGNVFGLFVMTFGTTILSCWFVVIKYLKMILYKKKDNLENNIKLKNVVLLGLFPVVGLIGSVVGHSLLNMTYAALALEQNVTSSMYIYPRYFGTYLGPLFLISLFFFYSSISNKRKYIVLTLGIAIIGAIYAFRSFLFHQSTFEGDILDAWRVMYPLNFQLNWKIPMLYSNYIVALVMTIFIFLTTFYMGKRRKVWLLTGLVIYQYIFVGFVFDKPYTDFVFDQIDGVYNLFKNSKELNNRVDEITYSYNFAKRAPYAEQYLMSNKKIYIEKEDCNAEFIVISYWDENLKHEFDDMYRYYYIDGNEIVLVKDKELKKVMKELGFKSYKLEEAPK